MDKSEPRKRPYEPPAVTSEQLCRDVTAPIRPALQGIRRNPEEEALPLAPVGIDVAHLRLPVRAANGSTASRTS